MIKIKKSFPVYDICSLAGGLEGEVIAERFAPYLKVHPNLHQSHRHTFYHLVLFTKGAGSHTIDFEQFDVQAGQMYFMIPGQVHGWNFKGEVDGYVINFSTDLLQSFIKDQRYPDRFPFFNGVAGESVINLPGAAIKEVATIFERILDEVKNKDGHSHDMICVLLAELFVTTTRNAPTTKQKHAPQQNQVVLHNFRKLVDEYYTEKRLPKEYATMLYVTPNHLNALCKDLLNKPAGEVIRDRILLEAKRLLINDAINIAEIAYELGFTDNSYFTKFFRKYTDSTPEEFRKSFINNRVNP